MAESLKLEDCGSLGEKAKPISKITRAKRVGSVVQVSDKLPCRQKALSSNPRVAQKQQCLLIQE
jgi:hypothetical protein